MGDGGDEPATRSRLSDGALMVQIAAGPFLRGSPKGVGEEDEEPQTTVTLKTYWIDQLEITVAQYERCFDAEACGAPQSGKTCNWGNDERLDHPINCVAWKDARDYCAWAGARLPTEAEWEKAARGTDGRKYPWGNQEPNCDLAISPYPELKRGCGRNTTWPVGSKPAGASPYGLLDVAGNVWEWCADYYQEDWYSKSPQTDPTGPATGSPRVNRGGGWESHDILHLRPSNRYKFAPNFRFHALGFRCAGD